MANPFDIANFNLTNFANILPDVLDSDPKTVEYTYKDANGKIKTKNVENRGLFKKHLWDDVGGALGQFNRTFYVDAENGDDNNDGSSSTPFKTIKKAVDSVPIGGFGYIYLVPNEYIINNNIFIYNKVIKLAPVNSDSETIIRNDTFESTYGTGTYGFLMKNGNLEFRYLTLRTANFISEDDIDNLNYYTGLINRRVDGFIGNVLCYSCSLELGDTPFARLSNRNTGNFIFYHHNSYVDKPTFNCVGVNKNGEIILNERGTLRVDFVNIDVGTDKDGNDLDYTSLITGIIRDADSGNPINVISNVNFSD